MTIVQTAEALQLQIAGLGMDISVNFAPIEDAPGGGAIIIKSPYHRPVAYVHGDDGCWILRTPAAEDPESAIATAIPTDFAVEYLATFLAYYEGTAMLALWRNNEHATILTKFPNYSSDVQLPMPFILGIYAYDDDGISAFAQHYSNALLSVIEERD